jgi:2,3-bisphosphoglycerate-dependent phosphoglycerate mutase
MMTIRRRVTLTCFLLVSYVSYQADAFNPAFSRRRNQISTRIKAEPFSNKGEVNGYSSIGKYSNELDKRGSFFQFMWPRVDGEENEDGWGDMRKKKRSLLIRLIRVPLKALFKPQAREPGTLILVRHGESTWNANQTFTGWADPDLTEKGRRESEHAARLLLEGGYEIDVVFTSRLKRAIRSTWIILQEMNSVYNPVFKSWRINERMYGALTGLGKKDTASQLGPELVQQWRGSLTSRPPAVKPGDAYWPGKDRKYADLSSEQIPRTESLLDCMERVKPLWDCKIVYELLRGKNVMVVAHANTLRGLVSTSDWSANALSYLSLYRLTSLHPLQGESH